MYKIIILINLIGLTIFMPLQAMALQSAKLFSVQQNQKIDKLSYVLDNKEKVIPIEPNLTNSKKECYFYFKVPSDNHNFSEFIQLACKIKQMNCGARSRIKMGLKEKSGEEWIQKNYHFLTKDLNTISCLLDANNFEQKENSIFENKKLDLNQIEEVMIYFKPQIINPSGNIQLNQIVLYGYGYFQQELSPKKIVEDFENLQIVPNQTEKLISITTGNQNEIFIKVPQEQFTWEISTLNGIQGSKGLRIQIPPRHATGLVSLLEPIRICIKNSQNNQQNVFNFSVWDRISVSSKASINQTLEMAFVLVDDQDHVWVSPRMKIDSVYKRNAIQLDARNFVCQNTDVTSNISYPFSKSRIKEVQLLVYPLTLESSTLDLDNMILQKEIAEVGISKNETPSELQIKASIISGQWDINVTPQITLQIATQNIGTANIQNQNDDQILGKINIPESTSGNRVVGLHNLIDDDGQFLATYYLQDTKGTATNIFKTASFKTKQIDISAPTIKSIKIDGKEFYDNDFVQSNPVINVELEDDTGIKTYAITLIKPIQSGTSVKETIQSVEESNLSNKQISVTLNITNTLETGRYQCLVSAKDIAGNEIQSTYNLRISNELEIADALCGPNPFNPLKESAHIQYQLSKAADIEFYIYAIDGERLYSTKINAGDLTGSSSGFNELIWNGQNRFGEVVANGACVGYLIAKSGKQKVVKKIKIAILK